MANGDVGAGFGSPGGAAGGTDFSAPDPGGSADIGLPNVPVKKKKKPVPLPPVTPLPQIIPPAPTPVSQEVAAFKETLVEIVEKFATATAAIAPPIDRVTTQPVGFAPALEQTLLGPTPPTPPAPPAPPAVPKKKASQGATPAAAVSRQRSVAAAAAPARTILTSGSGLLDVEGDETRRARKVLLGA